MVYEANSLQTLKNLVRRSDVISFMLPLTFVHEAELGCLRAIPFPERDLETATIDVITTRNRKLSAAAVALLATCFAICGYEDRRPAEHQPVFYF